MLGSVDTDPCLRVAGGVERKHVQGLQDEDICTRRSITKRICRQSRNVKYECEELVSALDQRLLRPRAHNCCTCRQLFLLPCALRRRNYLFAVWSNASSIVLDAS